MRPENLIEVIFNSLFHRNKKPKNTLVNSDNIIRLENCSSCNKLLDVKVTTNIDQRNYYIEGIGQLCKDCYNKTYNICNE